MEWVFLIFISFRFIFDGESGGSSSDEYWVIKEASYSKIKGEKKRKFKNPLLVVSDMKKSKIFYRKVLTTACHHGFWCECDAFLRCLSADKRPSIVFY